MKKIFLIFSISFTLVLTGCLTSDIPEPVSFSDQLASDIELIKNFISENGIDAEVDQSGIRYVVNDEGDGDSPQIGDRIALKFTASSLSGLTLLSDTIGLTLDLNSPLVDAWLLMFPLLEEGGSITAYTPSGYAYGAGGNNSVPQNENIIFNLELISVIDNEDEQFEIETQIIDEFLTESEIDFLVHPSGIRYIILEEGNGDLPILEDFVEVTFNGTFMNGNTFDNSSDVISLSLKNLIECWQIMLLDTPIGSTIKFYSPSVFCYGTAGSQNANILPNTSLVFEISLEGIAD